MSAAKTVQKTAAANQLGAAAAEAREVTADALGGDQVEDQAVHQAVSQSDFQTASQAVYQTAHRKSLLGPAEVRQLALEFGITPTKKLGQNFVHDPNTVRKIVRQAGVNATNTVLEVGPGLGSLTLGLTETGADVTAIEIDTKLASQLRQTVSTMQPTAKLNLIVGDALAVTAQELSHKNFDTLVANLPYNVSVPILMHLLELVPSLKRVLVMVQLEVGERIAAQPGSKAYGAPSAKAAWYGQWQLEGHISRQIFWPVPGVDSVLVGCKKRTQPLGSDSEKKLTFELINAAFGQRRKMLRQSLQQVQHPLCLSAASISKILEKANISPTARAETLSVHDWLAIARAIQAQPKTLAP